MHINRDDYMIVSLGYTLLHLMFTATDPEVVEVSLQKEVEAEEPNNFSLWLISDRHFFQPRSVSFANDFFLIVLGLPNLCKSSN